MMHGMYRCLILVGTGSAGMGSLGMGFEGMGLEEWAREMGL